MKPEHYKFIEDKWGDLMHTIAYNISGDNAHSHEDSIQALWVAAIDAIDGFARQNNGINGSIDEFLSTSSFNKYIKTVLWNCKNKLGANIVKKKKVQGNISSYTINEGGFSTNTHAPARLSEKRTNRSEWFYDDQFSQTRYEPQCPFSFGELEYRDFLNTLEEDEKLVVSTIIDNPSSMLENGRVNLKSISDITGLSLNKVNKLYSNLFLRLKEINQ